MNISKILINFLMIIIVSLAVFGCDNEKSYVLIKGDTKLYKEVPDGGPPHDDQVIAVLKSGDKGEVLSVQHSKDFKFYKVKIDDGKQGYLWFGDTFIVESKK